MSKILKFKEYNESVFGVATAILAAPLLNKIFNVLKEKHRGSKLTKGLNGMEKFKYINAFYEDEDGIAVSCHETKESNKTENKMDIALKNKMIYFSFVVDGKTKTIKCKLYDNEYQMFLSALKSKKCEYDKMRGEYKKEKTEKSNESFVGTGLGILIAVPIIRELYRFIKFKYMKGRMNKLFDKLTSFIYLQDFQEDEEVISLTYTDEENNKSKNTVSVVLDTKTKMVGFYFDIDGKKNSVEYELKGDEYMKVITSIEEAKSEIAKYSEEMKNTK